MIENKELLSLIHKILDEKKAENIKIIDIKDISSLGDYFLITNGNNINHVQALADELQEKLTANNIEPHSVEGYRSGEWIVLDYQDIIVHIFNKDARLFYDIERIWSDGKKIEL